MAEKPIENVLLIVAHPDDETLWAGGTILSHPDWKCFVISICRKQDANRAFRFFEVLKQLKAEGIMADLDDGPKQIPLDKKELETTILSLIPDVSYDLLITHNPDGEYTRHLRHEEIGQEVIRLWKDDQIKADQLWTFAYEDGGKIFYPRPMEDVDFHLVLSTKIWQQKYQLITESYGFEPTSWEAKTCPKEEAFAFIQHEIP